MYLLTHPHNHAPFPQSLRYLHKHMHTCTHTIHQLFYLEVCFLGLGRVSLTDLNCGLLRQVLLPDVIPDKFLCTLTGLSADAAIQIRPN